MPPVINTSLCKMCNRCVEACQSDVFYQSQPKSSPQVIYPDECWHCNACVMECPAEGAITLRLPLNMLPMYQERSSADCGE